MVTRMTAYSADVRATHVLTNAAVFGGSLMEAVALNPVAEEGDNRRRALLHPTTPADVVAKTALTGAALAATGAAYLKSARLLVDACLGQQQRRQAGFLERASNRPGRR